MLEEFTTLVLKIIGFEFTMFIGDSKAGALLAVIHVFLLLLGSMFVCASVFAADRTHNLHRRASLLLFGL